MVDLIDNVHVEVWIYFNCIVCASKQNTAECITLELAVAENSANHYRAIWISTDFTAKEKIVSVFKISVSVATLKTTEANSVSFNGVCRIEK